MRTTPNHAKSVLPALKAIPRFAGCVTRKVGGQTWLYGIKPGAEITAAVASHLGLAIDP
ncbi:hypothetical protein [Rhodococcus qingshengii]|uniref:hypothetical protein n=1 Tax=Rhodococcus qingshengii TaxID=334542 RepID=UPI0036DA2401